MPSQTSQINESESLHLIYIHITLASQGANRRLLPGRTTAEPALPAQ
jgi:hypothetical protein